MNILDQSTAITPYPTDPISVEVRLIFQWICYSVLGQAIAVFGITTNVMNVVCFVKQGFKDPMNISLLGLAISDLCSLVAVAWTNIGYNPALNDLDLSFDPIEIQLLTGAWPHATFTHVTSWITAFITLERCLCVTMPLKIKTVMTPKRVTAIIVCIFVVLIAAVSPIYCISRYERKFSYFRNKTILGLAYSPNRENVERISHTLNNILIPFSAFLTVIICTATLVVNLRTKRKWREQSVSTEQCGQFTARDRKVTKMVTMVSALFIACFFPVCVFVIAMLAMPELSMDGTFFNTLIAMFSVGFLLESTNSALNIFIYYHLSSRYRAVFRQIILCKVK